MKWNPALHLVAPCSADEFAVRHVLESLLLPKYLPTKARVADVGTGGGLPIIPCLLVRDDLQATLIEPSKRKCVFLRKALRGVGTADRTRLIAARFEDVPAPAVEFVTCRALDKFAGALPKLVDWAPRDTTFALFAGGTLLENIQQVMDVRRIERIPQSEKSFLVMAQGHTR